MKFLELTGFGNHHKHIINLKSISDIEFESNFTSIALNNGRSVNVIEDELAIGEMMSYLQTDIISANKIHTIWESHQSSGLWMDEDGDELPF